MGDIELDKALEDLREAVCTSSQLRRDECRALLRGFHALGASSLDVALVDYLGGLAEGRLVRGDNPVLMTMELVLEVLEEAEQL